MNALAAAALAAGELICQFSEVSLFFEALTNATAQVLSTRQPGRHEVEVRGTGDYLHLIQREGQSVRVTTLTGCTRTRRRGEEELCTRFAARHAWHFDTAAHLDPDESFRRQPSGAASGSCEPWRVEP
jgi:hypothetical protein